MTMRHPFALALAVLTMAPAAGSPASPRGTILLGQSWLGLWRGGRLVASREQPGWQFNAARLSADGRFVQIAAYPSGGSDGGVTVLRFDARTLAPSGKAPDAQAANWDPLPSPLGTDMRIPDATAPGGALVATPAAGGTMLAPRDTKTGASHHLPKGVWRAAVSPDGSTAAAFARPAASGARWPGQAWSTRTGQPIAATGLSIDDGSGRDNGAARSLACLLPNGEGAIFTYVGAPADSHSEYQPFGPYAGRAVPLKGPYVMTCLAPPGP
jgi:hypothetical protein